MKTSWSSACSSASVCSSGSKIPTKRWKFQHGDFEERKLWDDYMRAYEEALNETSTKAAPWYVVPADAKWFRNYVIVRTIVEKLESLGMRYPEPDLGEVKLD